MRAGELDTKKNAWRGVLCNLMVNDQFRNCNF